MKQNRGAPLLVTVTLLVFGGAGLGAYLWLRPPEPTVVDETPDQKASAVREAFVAGPDAAVDDGEREINALLESLGKALSAGDGKAVVQHYDYQMMLAVTEQQGLVPQKFRKRRAEMARRLRDDQAKQLATTAKLLAWVEHRIVKLRYLKERDEAVVYARHVDADGVVTKTRWWVVKQRGKWLVYDSEDLSMNLRTSTAAGMGLSAAEEGATWGPSLKPLFEAIQSIATEDYQGAHSKLLSLEGVAFPPQLEAMRLLMLGAAWLALEKPDEALAAYDRAAGLGIDMPILHYQRMVAYNAKGQYDKTLAEGKPYLDALGPDADVDLELGFAQAELGAIAEAETHLTRCLDDVPKQLDCLRHLGRVLPKARERDFRARLFKVDDVAGAARTIIETSIEEGDKKTPWIVIRALESQDPKHPLVIEYSGKLPPAP